MNLIFIIIFWISIFSIFHTYVLFPFILKIIGRNYAQNSNIYLASDVNLPRVSVVMAAYNEESVIEEKILSILASNYPTNKIEILIGSDNSTDNTNKIIVGLAKKNEAVKLFLLKERHGKAKIINKLTKVATTEIVILTDANVMFLPHTIYELVKHYKNDDIGLVGGNILNPEHAKTGISFQEKSYLINENKIKFLEGTIYGCMIGAFGGCYSIRKELYSPVPENFFMDDFFITMSVLAKQKKAINELKATTTEDVSNLISEEFRRKIRISIGNFQNLGAFSQLLLPMYKGVAFCFLSHKVLRWLTPFFMLFVLLSGIMLWHIPFYKFSALVYLSTFVLPIIDFLLRKIKIHILPLRFITHFFVMNLALLIGFFKYLKGVNTNVWQPTKRNQA